MSYFPGLFVPQHHKSRAGYFINHDLLIAASPETRRKLIFYFVAENTPQKLSVGDREDYSNERVQRIEGNIFFWSVLPFIAILPPAFLWLYRTKRATGIRDAILFTAGVSLSSHLINSTLWRTQEGRMLESSEIVERLSKKYNFGVWDFALAKKESHLKKLLEVYDVEREIVNHS